MAEIRRIEVVDVGSFGSLLTRKVHSHDVTDAVSARAKGFSRFWSVKVLPLRWCLGEQSSEKVKVNVKVIVNVARSIGSCSVLCGHFQRGESAFTPVCVSKHRSWWILNPLRSYDTQRPRWPTLTECDWHWQNKVKIIGFSLAFLPEKL